MAIERRLAVVDQLASVGVPLIVAVAIVMVLLRSLAALPSQVEAVARNLSPEAGFDSRLVSVHSIEEAELTLGAEVWVPVYYPDYLSWPPSSITVQRYLDRNVTLVFRYADQREALVLREFVATGVNRAGILSPPRVVSRRSEVAIGEGRGLLMEGYDVEGYDRNALYWSERGRFIIMAGQLPTQELVRMANSLRHIED